MRHLYSSRVAVLRLSGDLTDGTAHLAWTKLSTPVDALGVPGEMLCRLDLTFQRPGKDIPMPLVTGRAPDRIGLLFCDTGVDLRAGDRISTLAGPITGTFEIRPIPDPALDYASAHHLEVQVIEVAQNMAGYPSALPAPAA